MKFLEIKKNYSTLVAVSIYYPNLFLNAKQKTCNAMQGHYEKQLERAKQLRDELENQLFEIKSFLNDNPANPSKLRELKRITLDMTIANNEIEDIENKLNSFK